jgi:hypothetical protein
MADPNIQQLIAAARLLTPVLDAIVFVGGCTTGLFISDPGAGEVRPTLDVDVITEITSYEGYIAFSDRLRKLNFDEDTSEGAPLCRWKNGETVLDVMPLDEKILGFSNRWYKDAMVEAQQYNLEETFISGSSPRRSFAQQRLKLSEVEAREATSQVMISKT